MPAAPRLDPKTIFTPEEWAGLTRRSTWRGLSLVVHAWALIIGAGALVVIFPNPITYVLAVTIIGARQLGIAILVHDAAHGALHAKCEMERSPSPLGFARRRRRAASSATAPTTCSTTIYRAAGRPGPGALAPVPDHARYRCAARSSAISPAKPSSNSASRRLHRAGARSVTGKRPLKPMEGPAVRFWIVNGVAIAILTAAGYWWAWPALWVVPMATWLPLITRLRNIAEHAVPVRSSRSVPPRAHNAGQSDRALVHRALLGSLPCGASHVHAPAMLALAACAPADDGKGLRPAHGNQAELSRRSAPSRARLTRT